MKHTLFLVAFAIIITTVLSTPVHSEERDVRSPTNKDRDVWQQAALQGSRKRLSAREAVTLALQRRGWWADKWNDFKDDVKEGWQKLKNGTKAAWEAFKEHVGRDVAPYETYTDERRADEFATVEKRVSSRNARALQESRKRLSAREAVTLALQRRGWWSDRWNEVKEGAKKVGNKIKAGAEKVKEGWRKFKNGTKAAWKTFKEHVGRDVVPYETFTDERRADELATVDKRISSRNARALQESRKRLSAREAVTLALQRRGWWSDRWNDVKEGAKKVGDKFKAGAEKVKEGWRNFKNGTKAAWNTFKEHTGRESAPYETYTDERRADELDTVEKRVSSRNAPALSYKRTSAQKKVVAHDWYGNSYKGWKGILSPPIYSR